MSEFSELAKDVVTWLFNSAISGEPSGITAMALLFFIALLTIAGLVKLFLAFIVGASKLVSEIRETIKNCKKSPDEKLELRRRQQFCNVLRSDLATIEKSEAWNDQFFTDLEAQVEIEGRYFNSAIQRIFNRPSAGLRRVSSLIRAIETSEDPHLVVIGDPGSGKSVALRHLAHQFAERARVSKRIDAKIPLYVNLKEIPSTPIEQIDADFIKRFVIDNVRRGDADTAAYVNEKWQLYRDDGIWFFLFDSFDEIPDVLHAPVGSNVIEAYANAIRQFMAGMSSCSGVVASREYKGPDPLPWPRIRILPLSIEKQVEVTANSFLPAAERDIVRHYLANHNAGLQQSPMFVSLVCRHVKEEKRAPLNDTDILERHIARLAERDSDYVKAKFNIDAESLIRGARHLARLFAESPQLSLAPTLEELRAVVQSDRIDGIPLDTLLSALVYVKIGRADVQEARRGDRRFTFAHRRYQETLFAQYLSSQPEHIRPELLLFDARWREYAVTLLQTQLIELLEPILSVAESHLKKIPADAGRLPVPNKYLINRCSVFLWDDKPTIHLLRLLEEGLGRRLSDVPTSLRQAVEAYLHPRWLEGDIYDKKMVLQVCGLLPNATLVSIFQEAIRLGPIDLIDLVFRKSPFLESMPDSLSDWIRRRLSQDCMTAKREEDRVRLEALSARLPRSTSATLVVARCRRFRPIAELAKTAQTPPANFLQKLLIIRGDQAALNRQREFITTSVFATYASLLPIAFAAGIASMEAFSTTTDQYAFTILRGVVILALTSLGVMLGTAYFFRHVPDPISFGVILREARKEAREARTILAPLAIITGAFLGLPALIAVAVAWFMGRDWLDFVPRAIVLFFFGTLITAFAVDWYFTRQGRRRLTALATNHRCAIPIALHASSELQLIDWCTVSPNSLFSSPLEVRFIARMLLDASADIRKRRCRELDEEHVYALWKTCSAARLGQILLTRINDTNSPPTPQI